MANDTYTVEAAALPGQATVTIADDGTGVDWIVMATAHAVVNVITLQWSFVSGQPASASGAYSDGVGAPGNRLVVEGVIENARGADGQDEIRGSILANTLYGDPKATGSGGVDTLYGDAGNDTLYGGAGNDVLDGGLDDDRIFGGANGDSVTGGGGRDTVEGGAGADSMSGGGDLGDTLSYLGSATGVRVDLTHGATTRGAGGDAEGDRITAFTDIRGSESGDVLTDTVSADIAFGYNGNRFEGRGGADTLTMGGGADLAYGGDGGDEILGGTASDRLHGDAGNDDVWGGDDADTVWGDAGFDRVVGDAGDDLAYGGADGDVIYGGTGADRLYADAGNDLIFGNEDDDRLYGGDGDDVLIGSQGIDRLWGGAGSDEFEYLAVDEGGDRIMDFGAGDVVDLVLGAVGPLAWDTAGPLAQGGVRIVDLGADVAVRVNADADAAIEFQVTVVGVGSLTQAQVDL